MTWEEVDRYYLKSDLGYRISIARQGWATITFCGWAPDNRNLGYFDTADEAKDRCERHARGEG